MSGAYRFRCPSRRVNTPAPRIPLLLRTPACWNVGVQGPCVSTERGRHEDAGQVTAARAGAAAFASQETGWGRSLPPPASLQGHVLTGALPLPGFSLVYFPPLNSQSPEGPEGPGPLAGLESF